MACRTRGRARPARSPGAPADDARRDGRALQGDGLVARPPGAARWLLAAGFTSHFVGTGMPTFNRSARSRGALPINRDSLTWLIAGYPLFYGLGYLSKSIAGSAAIWPSHALTFAAFMLLPLRLWTPVILGTVAWDLATRPLLFWLTTQTETTWAQSVSFACANLLTALGPAAIARGLKLFRVEEPFPPGDLPAVDPRDVRRLAAGFADRRGGQRRSGTDRRGARRRRPLAAVLRAHGRHVRSHGVRSAPRLP